MTGSNWVCPACGRQMMSSNELCSGGFLDDNHPSNVQPVVGSPPVRASFDGVEDGGELAEIRKRRTA